MGQVEIIQLLKEKKDEWVEGRAICMVIPNPYTSLATLRRNNDVLFKMDVGFNNKYLYFYKYKEDGV